ncbi:hypothetical protein Dimus_001948 [Dionaea muscipula]
MRIAVTDGIDFDGLTIMIDFLKCGTVNDQTVRGFDLDQSGQTPTALPISLLSSVKRMTLLSSRKLLHQTVAAAVVSVSASERSIHKEKLIRQASADPPSHHSNHFYQGTEEKTDCLTGGFSLGST